MPNRILLTYILVVCIEVKALHGGEKFRKQIHKSLKREGGEACCCFVGLDPKYLQWPISPRRGAYLTTMCLEWRLMSFYLTMRGHHLERGLTDKPSRCRTRVRLSARTSKQRNGQPLREELCPIRRRGIQICWCRLPATQTSATPSSAMERMNLVTSPSF